jgi:hypothetical protein
MLRSISTKESFKGNNNNRMCLCLWLRVHQPRGGIYHWDDSFCVGRIEEAVRSSMAVSVLRWLIHMSLIGSR